MRGSALGRHCRGRAIAPQVAIAMALAGVCSRAEAQAYHDVAPIAPPSMAKPAAPVLPPEPADSSQDIAVATLRGLQFEAADSAAAPAARHAIVAIDLPLLAPAFLQSFDADLGRPLTFDRLAQIRRAVVQRYRDARQPLVDVYVPEQDVSDGVVRIVVATFRVGQVVARGNRYFKSKLLTGEMPLKPGEPVHEDDVLAGMALLNANPYRRVDVIYAPGAATGTTDVVLQTEDRLPLRVYAGYNNDGVPQLGRDRFVAGFDYGNLFGLDQRIGYQATASNDLFTGNPDVPGRPDHARYIAHAIDYVAPLPWLDRVEIFGLFARATPRLPESFGQTGLSSQWSFRYDHRLPTLADWQQQLQIGYDFKRSNNDLEFGGFQVFATNTHVHQLMLSYDAVHSDSLGQTHATATVFFSPGHLDSSDNDEAYDTARAGATPRYGYLQLSAQRDQPLFAGFGLTAHGQFQWTANTLLPSEEFSLGGDASVRGYDPYVAQGDRGWNLQTELSTPPLTLGSAVLQPFVFFDAGHVWNRSVQVPEANNVSLASAGAGVRMQFSRYVTMHGTIGWPLKSAVPNGSKAPLCEVFIVIGS
ncbi:ShlB/FhaC/HecB family hemolysin secretion/activation protein [Paraburkholderia sediminicola]|uniref:ShlB/FhaC/HecB family hemolysin secretion/activation protein n=1 Tax=Paraburkholderia sediminicola TaxID=458836 RepID=UPI0038B714B8